MDYLDEIENGDLNPPSYDRFEVAAYETIKTFFEDHTDKVFFGRQIEVIHESKFFHWVSNRALRMLVNNGVIRRETRVLKWRGNITIYWHNSLRYYKRPAQSTIALVENYSDDLIGSSIGAHCELLVVEGFSKLKFLNLGRNVREHNGKIWSQTAHDLDIIIERDGITYGVEVKNTLGYIEKGEYEIKIKMCQHFGIRPVFVVRMLPQNWIMDIRDAGGFSLILKYLLYPELLKNLAMKMRTELFLPVDTPRALYEGTLTRFEKWHLKNVK